MPRDAKTRQVPGVEAFVPRLRSAETSQIDLLASGLNDDRPALSFRVLPAVAAFRIDEDMVPHCYVSVAVKESLKGGGRTAYTQNAEMHICSREQ